MTPTPDRASRPRRRPIFLVAALALVAPLALGAAWLVAAGAPGSASRTAASGQPDFGPNVYVFSPSMPLSQIRARVNSIASQQASNQLGTQRYALLFEPGTYGSAADPLFLQVGYYTSVAGLGASPGDVVINGAVDSFNQWAAGFHGYGMGSYSFFNQGVPILATNAFKTASPPGSELHDLLTIFLSTAGSGGIVHVVNGVGRASTAANPDTPVNVVTER